MCLLDRNSHKRWTDHKDVLAQSDRYELLLIIRIFIKSIPQLLCCYTVVITRIQTPVSSGSAVYDGTLCTMTSEENRVWCYSYTWWNCSATIHTPRIWCPRRWQVYDDFIWVDIDETQLLRNVTEPTKDIFRSQACQGKWLYHIRESVFEYNQSNNDATFLDT